MTSLVQLEAARQRLRVQWIPTGVATNPAAPLGPPEVGVALDEVGGQLQVGVPAGVNSVFCGTSLYDDLRSGATC